MFGKKQTRSQMFFVFMSLAAVFIVGHFYGRVLQVDTSGWEVFVFENESFGANVNFFTEKNENQFTAILVNENDFEITASAKFALLKLIDSEENEWRVFPFKEEIFFGDSVQLPPGHRASYVLSEDMLGARFTRGNYRIAIDVTENEKLSKVWVGFEVG